jgi:hypothetical protein
MRPDLPVGLPLLGLSKDRPSIVPNRRVRRPGAVSPPLPSGRDSQSLPRAARVVSHHLDGFSSPTVQVCFALLPIMGFAVFLPVAKRASSQRIPALRSLPPGDSDGGGTSPSPWAHVTGHHCWLPFTACLAPSPFSPDTVSAVSHLTSAPIARAVAWRRGLEALLHRRVRCRRVRFQTRRPDAPLGLAGPPVAASSSVPASLRRGSRRGTRVPANQHERQRPLRGAIPSVRPPGPELMLA